MTDAILLEADEPPKHGTWVDVCDVLAHPTTEELTAGHEAGQLVDVDEPPARLVLSRSARGASDRDRALAKARELRTVMLDHGVPEARIDLLPGRPSAYGVWDALHVVDEMSHHTVSGYSPGNLTPVLGLCRAGRPHPNPALALPGPLCNGYGGWDLTYRIITFGWANHPGQGGPLTVPTGRGQRFTIPRDSARRYAWGTEWEGGLQAADWDRVLVNPRTGDRMTMREFMGRSNAALRSYFELAHHSEHSTWTSRKIDRLGYTSASGEAELTRYLEDDDVTPEDIEKIATRTAEKVLAAKVDQRGTTVKAALRRAAAARPAVFELARRLGKPLRAAK
ncbi:MAG TPA: hypothetical protein VMF51_18335 [Nocardioides sp.]|uniref:hypothetical protein n=1 Tax=Nocardioides sp. TaxID=35761 RepID=UPI002CCF6467|nr:hypothetical protein [Nocardioides sp.]HTW17095.1 hypothetical protein [Nocardioides sp.]